MNSEKYAVLLSILIKEFENRLHNSWKKHHFGGIIATPFSVDINTLPANFQMECIELQSDIQLKLKFDHVSLLDIYKPSLTREKYPSLHNHTLFMPWLFGTCVNAYPGWMKYTKSKISSKISAEHLESSLRIATTAISAD